MIHLAFLWHFHQPSYHDLAGDRLMMPWVRIHGAKDYTGMANLIAEFPEMHATANFSPCLLDQIEAYGRGVEDLVLKTVRKDPAKLEEDEKRFLRRQLYFVHPDRHVGAHPRYVDLRQREQAGTEFAVQDWIDLETLNALVWIHPTIHEKSKPLQDLARKGRGFTLAERDFVLDTHVRLLADVIPLWKRLQDSGQVEISVSPYYHPILPLLCNFEAAKQALPDNPIPSLGQRLAADADVHVARSRERAEELFGRPPVGCWPSEGSVSPDAVQVLARNGFEWFATDQAILEHSIGSGGLYEPHDVSGIRGVFRDTALSNLLGFTYKTWDADDAARDFIGRIESMPDHSLVVVALDGENAWEHYTENAVPFFRRLYGELGRNRRVRTVRMSEGIAGVRMGAPIHRLWSGSWINHNFGVWMGHHEDRLGWEMLGRVRAAVEEAPESEGKSRARECILQAEGSDWFWWFGDDYSSPQDAEFDSIFRLHLANACAFAGVTPPAELGKPIKQRRRDDFARPPWALLDVNIDGRRNDYFEWISAGHYDLAREFGSMSGDLAILSDLWFGSDENRILLRLDFRAGVIPKNALKDIEIRLVTARPQSRSIRLFPPEPGVETAVEDILEAGCPYETLGAEPGADVEFVLEVRIRGGKASNIPSLMPLQLQVPGKDRHKINWQV